MINPEEDGITHINVYSKGKTQLGKMLSNFYTYPIKTDDGEFKSVEGYWYWLGIESCLEKEQLRYTNGFESKKVGRELHSQYIRVTDDNFESKILHAIWYKAKNNTHLFLDDKAKLPFEHYYNYGGKVVDVKDNYPWMMEGIEKIRDFIVKKIK